MDCNPQGNRRATAKPHHSQPALTLEQQLAAVAMSLFLGRRRGTSAKTEWQDARRLVIPHAREVVR